MSGLKQPKGERQGGKRLWSKQEDELLCEVVGRHCDLGWAAISEEFNRSAGDCGARPVKRTNKQCRERWQNHLNPLLRNSAEWSQVEHEHLFTLFREYSHQWCRISQLLEEGGFNRRGDNHIKNYFYSSIKRAIRRINEVVRESNRAIKKQKSILYHYNQKYAYKKRLSLERQILAHPAPHHSSDSTSFDNPPPTADPAMRIIKELDQDIVSKVLLIAEQRGAKKFTISNKDYEEEAVSTRNTLIDYIKNAEGFAKDDVIALTTHILELSRKCKRKNCKSSEAEEDEPEGNSIASQQGQSQITPEQQQKHKKEEEQQQNVPKVLAECEKAVSAGENLSPVVFTPQSKKMEPLVVQVQRKNSYEDKNLLQRFLCEEGDQKVLGGMQKRLCSSEYSSNRPEEGGNSVSGYFYFGQEQPRLLLDQSNSYFYGSGCFSNNNAPLYDPAALPSLAYAEAFRSTARKEDEAPANLADFNFLSGIRELQPRLATPGGMFDFDFTPAPGTNPFAQGLFRSDSEQERLFTSQAQLLQRASSYRSNHSRSRPADPSEQQGQGVDLLQSQQLLNRSWAYSSSRLEQARLCSSNNYEAARKNKFTVDLRNSNFYPFSKQE